MSQAPPPGLSAVLLMRKLLSNARQLKQLSSAVCTRRQEIAAWNEQVEARKRAKKEKKA
jgi:hypothetical protein